MINITLKNKQIEATIREDTNLNFLSDKISVLADFKSCPKKFKDIFTNYLRNEFKSAMQQMKLQIIPPASVGTHAPSSALNSYNISQSQLSEPIEEKEIPQIKAP